MITETIASQGIKEKILSPKEAMTIFLKNYHEDEIKELKKSESPAALHVDFHELNEFCKAYIHVSLIDQVHSILNAGEIILNENSKSRLSIRLDDVSYTALLKDLDTEHIGQFISVVAMVKNITPIKAHIKNAMFECRSCCELISMEQKGEAVISEPGICRACGGRSFRVIPERSEFIDYRYVKLEEPLELRKFGATREFMAYMEGDLAGPQQTIKPGDVVDVTGYFDVVYDEKAKEWKFLIKIHNITPQNSSFEDVDLSDGDVEMIRDLSKKEDIFETFINSISPSIHGYHDVKAGIVLQLFEGNKPEDDSVDSDRWVIHILLIGDPGIGKSKMIREVASMAPKGINVSGTGSTEVGLTASAVKDELTGKWAMEAGAIVLADSGILCIDEFDKLSKKTMKSLNEPMEQLSVTTAKAGLVQTMSSRTSILAAANPKYSKFDAYKGIKDQINIPESTLSRFDLVYAMADKIEINKDKELADRILSHDLKEDGNERLSPETLKKYIAYAKSEIKPELSEVAKAKIVDFYVSTRQAAAENPDSKPITPRDLEAISRLSVARAKVELRDFVDEKDAEEAIDVFSKALKTIGLEPDMAGEIRGVKSSNEINIVLKAEKIIKGYSELYGLNLPPQVISDIKDEIKVHCEVDGVGADRLYKEAFSNIKSASEC